MDFKKREKEVFPQLVKDIRKNHNLSQQELALLFSPRVSAQAIGQWERGEALPARRNWPTLAKLAAMDLGQFYEYVGVGPTVESDLLSDVIHKISILAPEQLEIVSRVTAELWTSFGSKSELVNKQHLALLKKGKKAWNKWREKNPDILPQLAGIDLNSEECEDLQGINLDGANLADISGCVISFEGASLVGANLKGAKLTETDLSYANLTEANLEDVELSDINLDYSNLREANLQNISISNSGLREVNLEQTNLKGAKMTDVNLSRAILRKANLSEAKLLYCDLREVNFNEACLDHSILKNCTIYGISVWGTQTNAIEIENLYISSEGRSGLPVNDLLLAPTLYLCRQSTEKSSQLKEDLILEEEAIRLANLLLNKYGEYCPIKDYRLYINYEEATNPLKGIKYQVLQTGKTTSVEIFPDFQDLESIRTGKTRSGKILVLADGQTQSLIISTDIENLKKLVEYESKNQEARLAIVLPIIKLMIRSKKYDEYADERYKIKLHKGEVIILTNSEHPVELMRAKTCNPNWKIVNSSLNEGLVNHFQMIESKLTKD